MASAAAAVRDRCKASSEVVALAGDRVFRDERIQGTPLPAVVIYLISNPSRSTYGGRDKLQRARVQVDCLAGSRGLADQLADAVIAACEPAGVIGATRIIRCFVADRRDDHSTPTSGGSIYRTSLDLMVWHQPA